MPDFDVVVIGAGVAGLAALQTLDRAGLRVVVLEARDRIGGRIYTVHDPLSSLPLELGAEFIHGRPPELLSLIKDAGLAVYEGTDSSRYMNHGEVEQNADSWDLIGSVLDDMRKAAEGSDQSFQQFLESRDYDQDTKRVACGYIEGFNAASANEISIQALTEETRAADEIDGGRVLRLFNGYDAVPLHLLRSVPDWGAKLRLNTVAERVEWQRGTVQIHTKGKQIWKAARSVITVPLGVLQEGSIFFDPEPTEILTAVRRLRFGQVFRVVLRFREAFWEVKEELKEAGFILSSEDAFPTWWTTLSTRSTILVGWHSGARAESMKGQTTDEILHQALASLARIVGVDLETVSAYFENAYFHDWQADPYARGAYSYVPAGALDARRQLSVPVNDTLFFAGEATDQSGHSATVHGAIASGRRAARQVLAAIAKG